jgi:hypothetical protein
MKKYVLVVTLIGCLGLSIFIAAQSTKQAAPNVSLNATQIPDHIVYRYFLGHLNHLELKSQELAKQGQNADDMRDHYKKKLGLSDTETAKLKQIASELESQIEVQDSKAKAFIQKERAKFPGGKLPFKEALPKVPQELITMQQEKDNTIKKYVAQSKGALSKSANDKVDNFLTQEFIKNVSVKGVDIPRSHDPKKNGMSLSK